MGVVRSFLEGDQFRNSRAPTENRVDSVELEGSIRSAQGPVEEDVARGFLNALRNEYVRGQEGAKRAREPRACLGGRRGFARVWVWVPL